MEKNNLNRLTLVVPTYERQDYVLRLLSYWADKGPYLIVVDGSAKPIDVDSLRSFGTKIKYLHRPVGIYQRLSAALDLVKTEFVALAGDDEFFIPAAVEACIKELDKDIGLVACSGRALAFSFENKRVTGWPQYPRLEHYSVSGGLARERVEHHMRNYVPSLVYAICRAPQWKTAMKYTLLKDFPFFAASELQFEMSMAYAGRSKVLPELMWLRSHGEADPIRGTDPALDTTKRLPAWWMDNSNVREHEAFISIMSRCFNELLLDEGANYREVTVSGIKAYIEFYRDKRARNRLKIFRKWAGKTVPRFLRPLLKAIFGRLHGYKSNRKTEFLQAAQILEGSGVRVDFLALGTIQDIIINFHKTKNKNAFS